jgi:hypothetical protein
LSSPVDELSILDRHTAILVLKRVRDLQISRLPASFLTRITAAQDRLSPFVSLCSSLLLPIFEPSLFEMISTECSILNSPHGGLGLRFPCPFLHFSFEHHRQSPLSSVMFPSFCFDCCVLFPFVLWELLLARSSHLHLWSVLRLLVILPSPGSLLSLPSCPPTNFRQKC